MATFTASSAFDGTRFDFSMTARLPFEMTFLNNNNFVYEGVVYEDSLVYYRSVEPDPVVLSLDGSGIEFAFDLSVAAGTLTRLLQATNGTADWILTGISVAATAVDAIMKSAGTTDDQALFDSIFAGDDTILLSRAGDIFSAMGGADTITGNQGDDTLYGMAGSDILIGGRGRDTLHGGADADQFVYQRATDSLKGAQRDTIADFNALEGDRLLLDGIDANATRRGNQAFTFIEDDRFSGKAGELRFAAGILSADTDGDGKADVQIALTGVTALTEADLVL